MAVYAVVFIALRCRLAEGVYRVFPVILPFERLLIIPLLTFLFHTRRDRCWFS